MSNRKVSVPKDSSGQPMHRALGVPILVDDKILTDQWVNVINLQSTDANRVYVGLSVENPSASARVEIAFNNAITGDVRSISVQPQSSMAFDNLTFGPGVKDDTTGIEADYIRAKLSVASGTRATGAITYAANPADGQTVLIGDNVYEFCSDRSVSPGRIAVDIGASADLSWTALKDAVNANEQSCEASINTGTNVLTITSKYSGASAIVVQDGTTGATFPGGNVTSGGSGGIAPIFHIW